jgi:hypothetical protein
MNWHRCFQSIVAVLAATAGCASAQGPSLPRLETNQAYVEDVTRATTLAIDDPMAGFAFVLGSLPEHVKVYPTENYYYFRFALNGTRYAGDIRLDEKDRDQGKVHFGYYEEMARWKRDEGIDVDVVLDASHGVAVERVEALVYRVSYQGKSVVFALNDLSQVKPPASALAPEEKFIGPVFDESGIRFFFVYNSRLKLFYFILDETVPVADGLEPARGGDRILIGKRTGFAFYRDHRLDRKILIGAYKSNSLVNNYFDGPFDQLPENFIAGNALHDLIVDFDPDVKGKIDRLGHYLDGTGRYLIHPYFLYQRVNDLDIIHQCASRRRVAAPDYYGCFVFDQESHDSPNGRPIALRGRLTAGGFRRR